MDWIEPTVASISSISRRKYHGPELPVLFIFCTLQFLLFSSEALIKDNRLGFGTFSTVNASEYKIVKSVINETSTKISSSLTSNCTVLAQLISDKSDRCHFHNSNQNNYVELFRRRGLQHALSEQGISSRNKFSESAILKRLSRSVPVNNQIQIPTTAEALTETSTIWDRSLIRNSFFSTANQTAAGNDNNSPRENDRTKSADKEEIEVSSSPENDARKTNENSTDLDSASSSERARRSPYLNVPREALHRPMRPRPPRFRPGRPMSGPNYLPPPPSPPQNPYPIPLPLPYTQNQSPDYTGYGYDYGSAPEEPSPNNYNRVKRPAPPHPGRRTPPMPPRGKRPPRGPPPRPLPRPRHKGKPIPIRVKPPIYSYPKNAANIQDILTYFNEKENDIPQHYDPLIRPPSPTSHSPPATRPVRGGGGGGTGGSDFSKEFDDVQSSLLKDIREFAKRPSFMATEPPLRMSNLPKHNNHYKPVYNVNDEPEEQYEPHPKPVRDLVSEHPSPTYRHHGSNEAYGSQRYRGKGGNFRVKDRDVSYEDMRNSYPERHKHQRHESIEQTKYHRERDPSSIEDSYYEKNIRTKTRSKYSNSHQATTPYYDDMTNSEEERYHERDKSPSPSGYIPTTKPIVLKRPYGPYRAELPNSMEMKKPQSPYYTTNYLDSSEKGSYSSVPRVKAPTITYSPSSSMKGNNSPNYYKVGSPEVIEDIVEIHTDSPYRVDLEGRRPDRERERQEKEKLRRAHLHKLYLDYLRQKLEVERQSATDAPPPPSTTTARKPSPMRMKIHIYPNEHANAKQVEGPPMNGHYYYPTPTNGYSHSKPTIVSAPVRDKYNQQTYLSSHSHRVGVTGSSMYSPTSGTGPQMGVDKNKNVVLHLHVHRRQGLGGMETEASEIYTSTAKPLTYKEIYDEYQELHQNHKQATHKVDNIDDKSVSMELPIHNEKIDDVLQTLLQLRQQRNTS